MTRLMAGQLTSHQAAELLGVSERQLRRLKQTYEREGPAGLVHGNRGRLPVNVLSDTVREQVVQLAKGKYVGFNQQHFTEKLVEEEGLRLSRMSVHRILEAAGLASPRPRVRPRASSASRAHAPRRHAPSSRWEPSPLAWPHGRVPDAHRRGG